MEIVLSNWVGFIKKTLILFFFEIRRALKPYVWSKAKRWLWNSNLSKKTRAVIVQVVVESTMLFDCSIRAWSPTDFNKFQSVADRAYRFVWNNSKPSTLISIQEERINSFDKWQLGVESMRIKIEIRALKRMGHILRMAN